MSLTVRLTSDLVQVEAGATAPLTIEVVSRSEQPDQLEIQIEGLDPEWTAIPVPVFNLEAGETRSEKVFLKPPRASESLAGNYPFVVRVRSLNSGESRVAQGVLEIKPFQHLSVDVQPKRGSVGNARRRFPFQVTVMNLGNAEHTIQMHASDPDDACAFEFEQEKLTLSPGQQRTMVMNAGGSRSPLLANTRLYGFSVVARSISAPNVMGSAQAQLEQKALASPGAFAAFVALLVLIVGWFLLIPKPPSVDGLLLEKKSIVLGESVNVRWEASNAKWVELQLNGKTVQDRLVAKGNITVTPDEAGDVRVTAIAMNGEKKSDPVHALITVAKPAVVPPPRVLAFDVKPKQLRMGQTFAVSYKLGPSVVKATLSPPGMQLDPKVSEIELTANRSGQIVYRLLVENSKGETDEKSVRINVVDTSKATIVVFDVQPKVLEPGGGEVRLTYQFANAVRVELRTGDRVETLETVQGARSVSIDRTTTFTLIGYDDAGKTVERKIRVVVKPPPPPATDTGVETTGGAVEGGTTGGTG